MLYKKILVPVDGSPTAALGLKEAMRIARDLKAKLHLVHVVDELFVITSMEAGPYTADTVAAMRERGRRVLEHAVREAQKLGFKPASVLLESFSGRASDQIVAEARRCKADLIVIGTHGRRGVRRLVLGSDAEQIMREAPVPVLLVRAKAGARRPRAKKKK